MAHGDQRAEALVKDGGWDAHLAVHRVFDAHVEGLYEHLHVPMRLLVLAMHLRRQLVAHIQYEEEVVLPRCPDDLAPTRDNVARDHELLRDALKRLEEAALLSGFDRVDERFMTQRLVELDRLLEHHDDREADGIYGPLGARLDDSAKTQLLDALAATELRDPLSSDDVGAILERPAIRGVCERYRTWLDDPDAELPALNASSLPAETVDALSKLLARDERLVAASRERVGGSLRERQHRMHLADVSLRSTIVFVLEALAQAA